MNSYQFGSVNFYLNYFNWNFERYLKFLIPLLVIFLILLLIKISSYKHIIFLKTKFSWPILDFWERIVKSFGNFYLLLISLYWSFAFMNSVFAFEIEIKRFTLVFIIFYSIFIIQKFTGEFINLVLQLNNKEENIDKSFIYLLKIFLNIVLWLIGIIATFHIFNYNVNTLLGGLGVVSLIVGFSLQSILADFMAFFSIISDKPFEVGDFIVASTEESGTILKIGLKNTRIRTLKGDELILSNKDLLDHPLHNYGRMKRRRVDFKIGFEYQTPSKKLRKIPKLIENIISKIEDTKLLRVRFNEITNSALIFEVVYQVLTSNYEIYVNIQDEINYQLIETFEKEKINLAYPTQTLFVNSNQKK
jgi:small-conductance mechanosensitive channel